MEIQITPDERILIEDFMGQPYYFSKDWNGLMPVVEKIEEMMFQVEIHTAYTNINGELNEEKYNQDSCFEAQEETKLIITHRAVIRFINWYNTQTK